AERLFRSFGSARYSKPIRTIASFTCFGAEKISGFEYTTVTVEHTKLSVSAKQKWFLEDGFTWPSPGMKWKVYVCMWTDTSTDGRWVNSAYPASSISLDFTLKYSRLRAPGATSAECSWTS